MSTHADRETGPEPPAETAMEPDRDADSAAEESAADASFDAHDSAATFDVGSTVRLPNTVDDGNQYVG